MGLPDGNADGYKVSDYLYVQNLSLSLGSNDNSL